MATSREYGYNVIFEKEGDVYVATIPALGYSSTWGETLDEARAMVEDLIETYLESLRARGEEIPEPDAERETFTERISVALG